MRQEMRHQAGVQLAFVLTVKALPQGHEPPHEIFKLRFQRLRSSGLDLLLGVFRFRVMAENAHAKCGEI